MAALHTYCDELTALSTRTLVDDTLGAALRTDVQGAIVLLDIDHFKDFNERHGHPRGDELLREVAARLREALPMASCLARAGDDQFAAFLAGPTLDAALRLAQRCVEAVRRPVRLSCGSQLVTLSAGVASLDGRAGRTAEAVWSACDAALLAAKAGGRDCAAAFQDGLRQPAPGQPR